MISYYHSTARARALAKIDLAKAGSWCHVVEPTAKELDKLAEEFNLDRDLLEDATDIYEAPRIEISEGATYIFTRYCHPEGQEIATEPLLIIYLPKKLNYFLVFWSKLTAVTVCSLT
jgi:Mg2+ and Co2+ transporter CorA